MKKNLMYLALLLSICAHLGAEELDYPELYRSLSLPEYGNAEVTELGRDNSDLHDGIRISLFTTSSHAELREFYESQMQALGWELQETPGSARMRQAGMLDQLPFAVRFSKDDYRFQIITGAQGDGLAIHITVLEEEN